MLLEHDALQADLKACNEAAVFLTIISQENFVNSFRSLILKCFRVHLPLAGHVEQRMNPNLRFRGCLLRKPVKVICPVCPAVLNLRYTGLRAELIGIIGKQSASPPDMRMKICQAGEDAAAAHINRSPSLRRISGVCSCRSLLDNGMIFRDHNSGRLKTAPLEIIDLASGQAESLSHISLRK